MSDLPLAQDSYAPENGVMSFLLIAMSVDVPHHTPNVPLSTQVPKLLSDQATRNTISPELAKVAFAIGKFLRALTKPQCYASEACKFVYQNLSDARDILNRHGKLKGLVAKCPYLSLSGGPHGGTYLLTLNTELFKELSNQTSQEGVDS